MACADPKCRENGCVAAPLACRRRRYGGGGRLHIYRASAEDSFAGRFYGPRELLHHPPCVGGMAQSCRRKNYPCSGEKLRNGELPHCLSLLAFLPACLPAPPPMSGPDMRHFCTGNESTNIGFFLCVF